MHPLVNIAISAARNAAAIINQYANRLDSVKFSEKKENDLVSEVDLKAEQIIIDTIHKAYPSHGILAEESGHTESSDEHVWVIDPLDGTSNYLQGFPFYNISIAIMHKNRIEHGVVFDPVRNEIFSATRGAGARLNDNRIRVSKKNDFKKALIGTGIPMTNEKLAKAYLKSLDTLAGKIAGIRRTGAAALDLAYVACGRLDGFWEFSLKPWDIAAGSLLVKEAGGLVSDFKGSENFLENGNIVCGNPKIFKHLLTTLKPALID